jgi:hypothetical protein
MRPLLLVGSLPFVSVKHAIRQAFSNRHRWGLEKDAAMPDGWQLDRIRGGKGLPVSDKFVYARGQENICFREQWRS